MIVFVIVGWWSVLVAGFVLLLISVAACFGEPIPDNVQIGNRTAGEWSNEVSSLVDRQEQWTDPKGHCVIRRASGDQGHMIPTRVGSGFMINEGGRGGR